MFTPIFNCILFAAKEIAELWTEYEENSSPEAKIVKDFDKVSLPLSIIVIFKALPM